MSSWSTWSAPAPGTSPPAAVGAGSATPRSPPPGARRPVSRCWASPGEALEATLELKTVADVALVGFPNAGKSSLIAAMSAARPKIADYPFTTLVPHLGVVEAGDVVFTVADVPGLVPGASTGRGLGLEFLRHVERCSVLVHVVDCATLEPGRDPLSDLETIEAELTAYDAAIDGGLVGRPRLVVLNKVDVPDARELADLVRADVARAVRVPGPRGVRRHPPRAARAGLRDGRAGSGRPRCGAGRGGHPDRAAAAPVREDAGFTVEPAGEQAFVVRGDRPRRWVLQTDFGNDEAVGYLADRLARLGVEDALAEPRCPCRRGRDDRRRHVRLGAGAVRRRRPPPTAAVAWTSGSRRADRPRAHERRAAHDRRRFGDGDDAAPSRPTLTARQG